MQFASLIRKILVVICFCVPLTATAEAQNDTRDILVFGDSLTWGWVPNSSVIPSSRYAEADRWPEIMSLALGEGYKVITEGLPGRTTNIDDPGAPGLLNGAEYLDSALFSHEPLDLVIILLGTNDVKAYLDRSALEIGLGIGELINLVQEGTGLGWTSYERPEVLVISPPPLGDTIDPSAYERVTNLFDTNSREKLSELPAIYAGIAAAAGVNFFDAATVVQADEVGVDGIHLEVEGNRDLGAAVAAKVREILGN